MKSVYNLMMIDQESDYRKAYPDNGEGNKFEIIGERS